MSISERKQSFGNLARDYQKYRKSYSPKLYKLLFSLVDQKDEKITVLDIGCGTGKSTTGLITGAPKKIKGKLQIVGVDPDAKMLEEARAYAAAEKLPITYLQGSAEKLPAKRESLNAVVAGTAFHWFATKKVFTKIHRSLKPGGVCMVFWTWRKKLKKKKPTMMPAIFAKYKWQAFNPKWRDTHSQVRTLFEKSGFIDYTTISIPYVDTDNLEYLVGLCKTVSSYALLSAAQKKSFIEEMTVAYKKILGSKTKLSVKRELHICYAFKQK